MTQSFNACRRPFFRVEASHSLDALKCAQAVLMTALLMFGLETRADTYSVVIDPKHPLTGLVTLTFDDTVTEGIYLNARVLSTASEPKSAVCADTGIPLDRQPAGWVAPVGCQAVSWNVEFTRADRGDYAVSKQENIYHPKGWWLLTEWGSMLRRENSLASTVCASVHVTNRCKALPRVDQAPLLLAFGKHDKIVSVGEFTFRVFVGFGSHLLDLDAAIHTFKQQLEYLTEITHGLLPERKAVTPLDIVWLGIDPSLGQSGGAGGSQAIAANFIVDLKANRVSAEEQFRLLWVSAHEALHLLGINQNALWASESLATYLAFRSFDALPEQVQAQTFFLEMQQQAKGTFGLLEANRRVAQGEGQYLGVIYPKGAVFWREMDEGIREASAVTLQLSDFFPVLIGNPFAQDGALPQAFVDAVERNVPEFDIKRVVAKYL